MTKTKRYTRLAVVGLGAAALLLLSNDGVKAADHNEAPGTMADNAADIADHYLWHADGKLTAVMTFAGLAEAGAAATYDLDVLYSFHIDNDMDNVSDIDIDCRFGTNMAMEWGVQCMNIPGAAGPVEGPVETNLDPNGDGSVMVYAGSREDPFFFDLDGFKATLMSGQLMFDPMHDSFAGLNVTAIVIEMDADMAAGGATMLQTWITTGRKAP